MTTRFVPNPDFEDDWNEEEGPECKGAVGELVLQAAQAVAPIETGYYHDTLEVQEDTSGNVAVVSMADYGDAIEFGTSDTPVFAPLRRGVTGAGFRSG